MRASKPSASDDSHDDLIDAANKELWAAFLSYITQLSDSMLRWQFSESLNNDEGLLTFVVSSNHRTSVLWPLLEWIVENGPASYGLIYVHDDEDGLWEGSERKTDHSNFFRVHRILDGIIDELEDPFFGPIVPNLVSP